MIGALTKAAGSQALTPKSKPATSRVSPNAAGNPSTTPASASRMPSKIAWIDLLPGNLKSLAVFHVVRQPKTRGREFHAGECIDPVAPIAQELRDAGGFLVAGSIERNMHR